MNDHHVEYYTDVYSGTAEHVLETADTDKCSTTNKFIGIYRASKVMSEQWIWQGGSSSTGLMGGTR